MMNQLIQTKYPATLRTMLVCAITLLFGCKEQSYTSPEGYDINKPQKENLGKVLNEISGITFNNDDNSLLAISDSKEKVFEINVDRQKLKDYTDRVVPSNSDIEDVVNRVEDRLALEGRSAARHAIQESAEREQVAPAVDLALTDLLR